MENKISVHNLKKISESWNPKDSQIEIRRGKLYA